MGLYLSIAFFLLFGLCAELATKRKRAAITLENSTLPRENKRTRLQILFFIGVMLVLWFLTAYRSANMGNDTKNYIMYFNVFGNFGISTDSRIEIGYQILNIVVSKISKDPYFFLGVVATICYIGTGVYIFKYADNIVFSTILVFPVVYSFFASGLRQAIAMVICLYAYQAIKNKKLVLAFILIAFASSFHTTAWLLLLLLVHKFIPKRPFFVVSLFGIFVALSLTGIMDNIFTVLLGNYGGYYEKEGMTDGWLGITYYCLRNLVFYILVYLSYRGNVKKNSLALSTFSLLLITVAFGFSLNLFSRATNYFLLISIVELPNAIHRGKLQNKRLLTFLVIFVMVLYFLVTLIIRPEWNNLYPYEFYWN